MTAPTATVSPVRGPPGAMRRVPSSRHSTSSVALALSRRKSGWPARTAAPSSASQPRKVPWSMSQPRRGTVIGTANSSLAARTIAPEARIVCEHGVEYLVEQIHALVFGHRRELVLEKSKDHVGFIRALAFLELLPRFPF